MAASASSKCSVGLSLAQGIEGTDDPLAPRDHQIQHLAEIELCQLVVVENDRAVRRRPSIAVAAARELRAK